LEPHHGTAFDVPETGLGNRGVGVMFFEIDGQHMASLPIENALFEQGKGIQIIRLLSRFPRFPQAPAFAGNWKSCPRLKQGTVQAQYGAVNKTIRGS
jgi:hypothetical protein